MPGVCFLTETYYPLVGGGETQTRLLAAGLAGRGIPVMVVARRSSDVLKKVDVVDEVTVCRTPPVRGGRFARWLMVFACVPVLLRRRRQYGVIYVSGFKALGLTAVVLSRLLGKRCVLKADSNGEMSGAFFARGGQALGLTPESRRFRLFLALRNAVLRRADRFVAISSEIATELRHHGVQAAKIELVPNAVDTGRFSPAGLGQKAALRRRLGLPQDRTILIYTGRLVSYKGLSLLVAVWDELRRDHHRAMMVLVGAGGLDVHNCEAELRASVRDRDLQDSVRFTGDVHNVHEYLQASDIFVFPTRKEAFGISLIEAMACGLPVVATRTGGIMDILVHEQNGLLIEAGNASELRGAIERLMADPSLAASLGDAALRTARVRYARKVVLESHIALFSGLGGCTA